MMVKSILSSFVSAALLVVATSAMAEEAAASAATEPNVRVRIVHTVDEIIFRPQASFKLAVVGGVTVHVGEESILKLSVGEKGVVVHDMVSDAPFLLGETMTLTPLAAGNRVVLEKVPFGVGWWWESSEEREYDGELSFSTKANGKLDVVLTLPVEEYLRGVVPSEIGATSPTEALKAQAVAARSETMTALSERTYAGPGFDICADVDCQVYSGIRKRNEATDAAIRATRGVILSYDGKPIPAYYASNCGGFSEDIKNVWPGRDRGVPCWNGKFDGEGEPTIDPSTEEGIAQWLEQRPNVYCNHDFSPQLPDWTWKNFRWEVESDAGKLTTLVAKRQDIGRVTAIEPLERGPSGRLKKVRFVGETGSVEVGPELAIRQVWEPPLKSSAFLVEPTGENKDRPDGFRIRGAGYGHGVGMCQTGAIARAQAEQDYRTILQHYYTDATVGPAYE